MNLLQILLFTVECVFLLAHSVQELGDPNNCQLEIVQIFNSQKTSFECSNGCIKCENQDSIELDLDFSSVQEITTCIQFINIKTLVISTLLLDTLSINLNTSQMVPSDSYALLLFQQIENLNVQNLFINSIATNVTNLQLISTSNLNKISIQSIVFNFQLILTTNLEVINFSANDSIYIQSLQILQMNQSVVFEGINQIEIQEILYYSLTANNLNPIMPSVTIRSSVLIKIPLLVAGKRGSQNYISADLLIEPIQVGEQIPQIQIGNITSYDSIHTQFQWNFYILICPFLSQGMQNGLSTAEVFIEYIDLQQKFDTDLRSINLSALNVEKVEINNILQVGQIFINCNLTSINTVLINSINILGSPMSQVTSYYSILRTEFIQNIIIQEIKLSQLIFQFTPFTFLRVSQSVRLSNISFRQNQLDSNMFFIYACKQVDMANIQITQSTLKFYLMLNLYIVDSFNIKNFQVDPLIQKQNVLSNQVYNNILNEVTQVIIDRGNVDISNTSTGFFLIQNSNDIQVSNSMFKGCSYVSSGGCISIQNSSIMATLSLRNCRFIDSSSFFLGGAIFGGILIHLSDTSFIGCSSMLGGAMFLDNQSDPEQINNAIFEGNSAFLSHPDSFNGILDVRIESIYEYNPNLKGTDFFLVETSINSDPFFGLLYLFKISLQINGQWMSELKNSSQTPVTNLFSLLGNDWSFFEDVSDPSISFLNLKMSTFQLQQAQNGFQRQIQLKLNKMYTITYPFLSFQNQCGNGMEAVQINDNKSFFCQYCQFSKAIYQNQLNCSSCNSLYFGECYANVTQLQKGYWRSVYTLNISEIIPCIFSSQNCEGGNSIGNSLCAKGHIGPQCLDCDIKGQYWNESFSRYGVFSCNQCNEIFFNEGKIIISFVIISLSLIIILIGNFKHQLNTIYAQYLGRMKLIFIGSSLNRLSEMSTYVKILLFNLFFVQISSSISSLRVFSTVQQAQIAFNHPIDSSFFSLDCMLIDMYPNQMSIGYTNLILSIIIPSVLLFLIVIGIVGLIYFNQLEKKTGASMIVLSSIYLFLLVFYSFILELCLKSFTCIKLDQNMSYSLLDLSQQCDSNNQNLDSILNLSIPVFIFFSVFSPILVLGILFKNRNNLNRISITFSIGLLYKEYKIDSYYWEFIRLSIKAICIFIQVGLIEYSQAYSSLISMMIGVYLVLLMKVQPFRQQYFERLEKVSMGLSLLNLQTAQIYQQYTQTESSDTISLTASILFWVSQILNLLFIFFMLIQISLTFLLKQLRKLSKYFRLDFLQQYLPGYSPQLRKNFIKFRECVRKVKEINKQRQFNIEEKEGLLKSELYQDDFSEKQGTHEESHSSRINSPLLVINENIQQSP